MKKRARGRAYLCACGEETLRLKKSESYGTVGGFVYLFGACGGGVKIRRDTGRFGAADPVSREEATQLQATRSELRALSEYERLAAARPKETEQAEAIWTAGFADFQRGAAYWYRWGEHLERIKELLGHGDFGAFVRHRGLDPTHAHQFIQVSRVVRALPAYSQTFANLEPTKVLALARLQPLKRREFLEEGVPVGADRRPITAVTFRALNQAVQAVNGKSPRGRKATATPAPPPRIEGIRPLLSDAIWKVRQSLEWLNKNFLRELQGLPPALKEQILDPHWTLVCALFAQVDEVLRSDE